MRYTTDIEDALQEFLNSKNYQACAQPVPPDLAAGQTVIYRTGGTEQTFVSENHYVYFDVYHETDAQAMELANTLTGEVRELVGEFLGDVPCYTSEVTTLPYLNPDTRHESLSRVSFGAEISTRLFIS